MYKIRVDEEPYFIKLEDPGGVVTKTDEWWLSNRYKGDPAPKIHVRLPKGKLRFKYTVWAGGMGWNTIYLIRTRDDKIIWKRPTEWSSGTRTYEDEVEIPEEGEYHFRIVDGSLGFEKVALHCEAWVAPPTPPTPAYAVMGGIALGTMALSAIATYAHERGWWKLPWE